MARAAEELYADAEGKGCLQDLGKDLVPVIKGFFASKEYKTGVPDPNADFSSPYEIDVTTIPGEPFNFENYIRENIKDIDEENGHEIFPNGNLNIHLFGPGESKK